MRWNSLTLAISWDMALSHSLPLPTWVLASMRYSRVGVRSPFMHTLQPPGIPFLIVESTTEAPRPISLDGQAAFLAGISAGAKMIVVRSVSLVELGRKRLLALDLRSGMTVHDLTPYITEVALRNL